MRPIFECGVHAVLSSSSLRASGSEALNDDDDRYRLVESPEAENMDALNDPEEQEVVAKTPPVEDGFVDEAFDAPKSDEQPPQSFEPQDFVTTEEATENPTEEAPENP